jgi:hypothetical protein
MDGMEKVGGWEVINPHEFYEGWNNPWGGKWYPKSRGRVENKQTFPIAGDK